VCIKFSYTLDVPGIALNDIRSPSATKNVIGPTAINKAQVEHSRPPEKRQASSNDQVLGSTIDSHLLRREIVLVVLDCGHLPLPLNE
jgi:hypothetical protein